MDFIANLIARKLKDRLHAAETTQVTLLLEGPTGTGKSTLAHAIHTKSSRAHQPFVTINLASLHVGTFEGALFGQEKGAFTGADASKQGLLAKAHLGTLFLDEIGDLTLSQQARLLEFLQTKRIRPLGATEEQTLDVRIMAATHKDLAKETARGRFREDLLYRLRVLPLQLPSLWELRDHFDEIVHLLLAQIAQESQKTILGIDVKAARILENYTWPGNYRELESALKFAVLTSQHNRIRPQDLPEWLMNPVPRTMSACAMNYRKALRSFQRAFFSRAAKQGHGNLALAARISGLNRSTFLRLYKKTIPQDRAQSQTDLPRESAGGAASPT